MEEIFLAGAACMADAHDDGQSEGEGKYYVPEGRSLAHRLRARMAALPRRIRLALAWLFFAILITVTFIIASLPAWWTI
ncbi:hypothetical protein [Rhizobium binae]|uniref:hypothetical protein n=1 Tax=Rhizobium binae TaxID=1138190 RepID=UPI001C83BA74|nr:hypothetical protein [Rhizobium binae]MBX4940982.1 hypothetical protein [Rhizobium binae]MBX4942387.1 hypothetical protein [Rhizobium binae]MBX4982108.1 hypothetical protein [Rhizobium binae]